MVSWFACGLHVHMCPFPSSNRCLGLVLLTKCGVVVGVFGLGPKGRGLDSLHCVGCPLLVVWVLVVFRLRIIFPDGCPIGYPYAPEGGIRGPEGARKRKRNKEVKPSEMVCASYLYACMPVPTGHLTCIHACPEGAIT